MKNFKYWLTLSLLLAACGSDTFTEKQGPKGDTGSTGAQGPKGDPGPAASPLPTMEGYYVLPNGGYLDIYQDAQGLYTVRTARLTFTNTDGSIGVLPVTSISQSATVNGALYNTSNQTYTPATHNIINSTTKATLSGSLLTQLKLTVDNKKATVKVTVTSNATVVFTGITVSE